MPRLGSAAEVVRHLGCVQSQLHEMALWAVARRTNGLALEQLNDSFESGQFLRTHVLRPTWHYVDPADIHWLLALTAPRIRRLMASSNATIGLTEQRLDAAASVITTALADEAPLTRTELADALARAGLEHRGQQLAHVVMHAEINALVVNGPMRGKQHTYLLLESRVATPPSSTYDELLAAAARRYGIGHGPFRDKDLAWWTSLTLTDSRKAITLAGLRPFDVGGHEYWAVDAPGDADIPRVMLLSNFDEYISYARDPEDYALFHGSMAELTRNSGLLLLDGRLAGTWTRKIKTTTVDIDVRSSARITGTYRRAILGEAEAYGRFVQREPVLRLVSP